MLEVYWGCLILGVLFSIVTVLFGDLIGQFFDGMLDFLSVDGPHFMQPMVLVGGVTVFGGSGILLTQYTYIGASVIAGLSLIIAIFLSIIVYFCYVRPMQNAENSIGYSIQDLIGKIAEVSVPIPLKGYGEVIVKVGAMNTNHIAGSFDLEEIETGSRVVVVEVKEGVLLVSHFEHHT